MKKEVKTLTIKTKTEKELIERIKSVERDKNKLYLSDFRNLTRNDFSIVIFYEEKRRCIADKRRN